MGEHTLEQSFVVPVESAGWRLDQFLVSVLGDVSRSRIQQFVADGVVRVDGAVERPSLKLRGGETVVVVGETGLAAVEARAEAIPLEVVYEDEDLAVVNKPAGMMVHAGSGATEEARSAGTLVNALLHRFETLSGVGGELRPGIVHRLDKETSGLIVIARNDQTHEMLAAMFSEREMTKTYIALVEGHVKEDAGTIREPIGRDTVRRTRMTTRRMEGGREAVTHYRVTERLTTPFGKFTMIRVRIETGRTHQIRVHMAHLHHPVVGDTLYGAAGKLVAQVTEGNRRSAKRTLTLGRNFLHAAELEFTHPKTGEAMQLATPLPAELTGYLEKLRAGDTG